MLRTLEIRHYGPVCDVSETGLYCYLHALLIETEFLFAKGNLQMNGINCDKYFVIFKKLYCIFLKKISMIVM